MRRSSPFALLAAAAALLTMRGDAVRASALALPADFSDALVASVGSPTALAFTPDGRMLISTQGGRLHVYENGTLLATPALDLAAAGNFCSTSERGLLGVAVDPAFADNGYLYLYYSPRVDGECKNRLSRFTMTGNTVSLASQSILLDNIPAPLGTHNAGDVHVGKDGHLYVSVGDGGCNWENEDNCSATNDAARGLHALVGKIVRITRDGGIPADNPFQGEGTARCHTGPSTAPNKCQEIFATGLRNPFRIAFDPNAAGTEFLINDVGQNTWEEVDRGASGADYGWNVREGPCKTGSTTECGPAPAGMTNPIFSYRQGDPSGCSAITGGAFVPAGVWPPAYDGTYLFADYVCGRIFRLDRQPDGTYLRSDFATGLGSNSAVSLTFGPYEQTRALYYTTYAGGGSIRRIAYTGSANRVPTASVTASPTSGPVPLHVEFDGSASTDPDAGDTLTYEWDFGDGGTASGPSPTIGHTYAAAGTFEATLRVRDNHGALSPPATIELQPGNSAPAPVIETPVSGARFRVGETVVLRGSATDSEDGTLASSSLRWRVLRHHGTSHTHPWLPETAGNEIPIATPPPEDLATTTTSYLEVQLTAADSHGLAATVTREYRPILVDLALATEPAGLALEVNGERVTAPHTFASWEAWAFPATAVSPQQQAGSSWTFDSWADGGATTRTITTGSSAATYTARYRTNAAPVAANVGAATPEDGEVAFDLAASDPDGGPLTFAVVAGPTHGSIVSLAGTRVRYRPPPDYNGPDSFTFRATDGVLQSNVATATVAVRPVNDAPLARPDSVRASADGPVEIDVLANDSPGPADESGQALRLTGVGVPGHGRVAVVGGRAVYTPSPDYDGADAFTYTVCDDGGPASGCATGGVNFAFSAFPLPINVRLPRVVGGTRAGTVAVAEVGGWHAAPLAAEYRWLRCLPSGRRCTGIIGATGDRYPIRLGDVGRVLRVRVTVRNRFGAGTAISGPTRVVGSPVEVRAVRHRGDDWVMLGNRIGSSVSLRGWTLFTGRRLVHKFGRATIGPGRILTVDTGEVWGARGRAVLRLPGGRTADSCAYDTPRSAVATC